MTPLQLLVWYMTFEELVRHLEVEGFEESASEIHGLLAGRVAGGERIDAQALGSALVESFDSDQELVENALPMLQTLYASIVEAFERPDFSFHPLLPGDDVALSDRVVALSEWCQHFLSGLGDSGLGTRAELSEELNGAIADIAAIAQVSYDGDDEEEDEMDLFELEEYVRMAAMMIFAELNGSAVLAVPSHTLH